MIVKRMYISMYGVSFVMIQLCLGVYNHVSGNSYIAGVVEFAPEELLPTITPQELILSNAEKYYEIIEKAAVHGVDILVFPEYGLTGHDVIASREIALPYATELPAIGVNPCSSEHVAEVLAKLSCAARDKRLYLVINLAELTRCDPEEPDCPSDGTIFYNTDVAFDRDGTIVSKYRKFNLYREPVFSVTKSPDHSWFDTDFGVRFGIFICADILYPEPTDRLLELNISNYIFSTAWASSFPFYAALPIQAGWAFEYDVNLLASGYSNASRSLSGSGIYGGRDGTLVATFSQHSTTKLLVAKVPTKQRGVRPSLIEQFTFKEDKNSVLSLNLPDMLNKTSSIKVTSRNTDLVYVTEEFNCSVHVSPSAAEEGHYWLVAYSGNTYFEIGRMVRNEICGVVACLNSSITSCNQIPSPESPNVALSKIAISSSSKLRMLSYPVTLDKNLLPLNTDLFKYVKKEGTDTTEIAMSTDRSLDNIMSLLILRNADQK